MTHQSNRFFLLSFIEGLLFDDEEDCARRADIFHSAEFYWLESASCVGEMAAGQHRIFQNGRPKRVLHDTHPHTHTRLATQKRRNWFAESFSDLTEFLISVSFQHVLLSFTVFFSSFYCLSWLLGVNLIFLFEMFTPFYWVFNRFSLKMRPFISFRFRHFQSLEEFP